MIGPFHRSGRKEMVFLLRTLIGNDTSGALRRIVALALVLRLAWSFLLFPAVGESLHWKGVDDGYDEIARNLLDGNGFVGRPGQTPNLLTPPGYVFFLYLLYGATGREVNEGVRIRLVQPLLDAVCCVLIFLLGRRLFRRRRVALAGALAWALYPQIIVYNARVAPEVLFTLLLTAMVLFWIAVLEEGRMRDALLMGAFFALAALVKEKIVFLPPLLLAPVLFRAKGNVRRRVTLAAAATAAMVLLLAPWLIRGYRLTGLVYPITLRSGRALDQGLDESFSGADTMAVHFFREKEKARRDSVPPHGVGGAPHDRAEEAERAFRGAERERDLIGASLERIAADPLAFVRAFFVKAAAFWYFGQPKVIAGNIAVQIPILLLAVAGYWKRWRRYDLLPFLLLSGYFIFIHALTIVRMRYSIPIMPETILVAAAFLFGRMEEEESDLPGETTRR